MGFPASACRLRYFLVLLGISATLYSVFFFNFDKIHSNVQQFIRPFNAPIATLISVKTTTLQPLITTLSSPWDDETRTYFEKVYKHAVWGKFENRGFSGWGSMPSTTVEYRKFLEDFFVKKDIRSVLDIPCGMWSFTNLLHWGPVRSYVGFDIVKDVIDYNIRTFGKNKTWRRSRNGTSFHFGLKSLMDPNLPPADLVICKDSLQHLPLSIAQTFLKNALPKAVDGSVVCKYKFLLITNDFCKEGGPRNPDIPHPSVDSHCRDFSAPPFGLEAPVVFQFPRSPKRTQLIDLTQTNCSVFL